MREPEAITSARCALGTRLAAYRRAAGLTQMELASRIAFSRSTIANVETGRQHVPRGFWAGADTAVHAGGVLVAGCDDVEAARRACVRAVACPAKPATLPAIYIAVGPGAPAAPRHWRQSGVIVTPTPPQYTEDGLRHVPDGMGTARLHAIRARALTGSRDFAEARAALQAADQASAAHQQDQLHDRLGGEFAFGTAKLRYYEALVLTRAGYPADAETARLLRPASTGLRRTGPAPTDGRHSPRPSSQQRGS